MFEGEAKAVIELASFRRFSEIHLAFLDQVTQSLGIVLNTIAATMRTEELLKQSQALAEELQKTNAELEEKAHLLAEQKTEVETKNREVEQAKAALEDKAEQLSLTSKYKSEFLANMSHELRTPLNNLLILAQMLAENPEKNLSQKQVKYAETIHTSGTDLLALINDILDLSKIESGKMDVEIGSVRFTDLRDYCSQTFRHVADGKGLDFTIDLDGDLPAETMHTDAKRLQQVLKNLLSNALKFTEQGTVQLRIERAAGGWSANHSDPESLQERDRVLGDRLPVSAFRRTSRRSSSRRSSRRTAPPAASTAAPGWACRSAASWRACWAARSGCRALPGVGSTFTLYLPQVYVAMATSPKAEAPLPMTIEPSGHRRRRNGLMDRASWT